MRSLHYTPFILLLSAYGCSERPPDTDVDDFGYQGTGIGVTIAPLELASVTDACYSFEIVNGSDETVVARGASIDPQLPGAGAGVAGQGGDGGPPDLDGAIANPLCSTRFGNEQGAISYVAPCDASAGSGDNATHTVRLWVNSVCAGGTGWVHDENDSSSCQPLAGFVNPCGSDGCTVTATCVENADVPVEFNFTVMASAQQGFFDVAVNFDNVFCSAKLDTCYEAESEEQPDSERLIRLVHDDEGTRQHTAVAAVACSAGTGSIETTLHLTELTVTCSSTVYALDLGEVVQEGNLVDPNPTFDGLNGSVYYGTEALEDMNKVFVNVAFAIPPAFGGCTVDWTVVPSDSEEGPQPSSGDGGALNQVAGVVFDPAHTVIAQGNCANFSLNGAGPGDGEGVVTRYLEDDEEVIYTAQLSLGMTEFAGEIGDDDDEGEVEPLFAWDPPSGFNQEFACSVEADPTATSEYCSSVVMWTDFNGNPVTWGTSARCPAGFCTTECNPDTSGPWQPHMTCRSPPWSQAYHNSVDCENFGEGLNFCVP